MTNKINYNTRIVVIIAILALLLGLILGGIFSIVREDSKPRFIDVSDESGGYMIMQGPVLLSEIDYYTSCSGSFKKVIPWEEENFEPSID